MDIFSLRLIYKISLWAQCIQCYLYGTGFLSLSCGATSNFIDSTNISWISDNAYVDTGNTTAIDSIEGTSSSVPIRFFPESKGRKCYRLPVKNVSSVVLVRTQFVYKNYDGLARPPAFSVSLGTAITTIANLTVSDPWTEELVWSVNQDILPLCLHAIPGGGVPVISSLEIRPLPQGVYTSGMEDFPNKSLRKCFRINCGYANGSLRWGLFFIMVFPCVALLAKSVVSFSDWFLQKKQVPFGSVWSDMGCRPELSAIPSVNRVQHSVQPQFIKYSGEPSSGCSSNCKSFDQEGCIDLLFCSW